MNGAMRFRSSLHLKAASAVAVVLGLIWHAARAPAQPTRDAPGFDPQDAAQLHMPSFEHAHLVRRGFSLARSLHGEHWLTVYTHSEKGELSIHAHGVFDATAAEVLSVLREVELLPQWNRYCDTASVLRLMSHSELWAAAGVRLPWPVPRQALRVHVKLAADTERKHAVVAAARSVRT